MNSLIDRLARLTTGKLSAWLVLLVALALTGAVMMLGASAGDTSSAPDTLPSDAESARVAELQQEFPGGDIVPAIAVIARADGGLTPEDQAAVNELSQQWGEIVEAETTGPIPSEDGRAVIVSIPVPADTPEVNTADVVEELRAAVGDDLPAGLSVELTGGAAFGADISKVFQGADVRLLVITAIVVAVLLVLTYRSPVLWLVPLIVILVADRTAAVVTELVAEANGTGLDGSTAGITSVLVFGAGTNYALLLVSRYREELRRHPKHRDALAAAVRGAAEAIVASNLTVVLALLVLLFSVAPNSQSLGISAAIGLLVALVFALFVLPAALSLFGRRLFWPFVPHDGEEERTRTGAWFRVASAVVRRPVAVLVAAALVLGILASGLLGLRFGLSQADQFRVEAESVDGLATVAEHFPPGAADPVTVLAAEDRTEDVLGVLNATDGVVRANPTGTHDGRVRISATLDAEPSTERSLDLIRTLRADLDEVEGADALIGGSTARDLDSRDGATRDLRVVMPLIVLVVLVVLLGILRSVVTPLLLIGINLVSTLAALGLGTWVSNHVLGFPALDVNTPVYAFLFLVALGIDYTVFLVLRAREERPEHGTVGSMVLAVGLTGGVITSAGIVLAAVFTVLGVLPLITLTQVGVIVGLGVLLDTFLVRTVVVPAVFALLGDRAWWPQRVEPQRTEV